MTEPEPTQPEPAADPGHVLPQDVWDEVVADRDQIEEAIAASAADPTTIEEVPDEG